MKRRLRRLSWAVASQSLSLLVVFGLGSLAQVIVVLDRQLWFLGGVPLIVAAVAASAMFVARGVIVGKWWLGLIAAFGFLLQSILFEFDQGADRLMTRVAGVAVVLTWALIGWYFYFHERAADEGIK